jgi:hypothetical protein
MVVPVVGLVEVFVIVKVYPRYTLIFEGVGFAYSLAEHQERPAKPGTGAKRCLTQGAHPAAVTVHDLRRTWTFERDRQAHPREFERETIEALCERVGELEAGLCRHVDGEQGGQRAVDRIEQDDPHLAAQGGLQKFLEMRDQFCACGQRSLAHLSEVGTVHAAMIAGNPSR